MKNKKVILFLFLTIIWMIIVFCFSAENATVSKETSLSFMEKIIDFFDINITNKAEFESVLRSFAHFGLFLFGGAVSSALFIMVFPKRQYLYCTIFGIIYSLLDEIHQIFVPGRAFEVKDIIIDFIGFFTGVAFITLIRKIRRVIIYNR